jgi:hypothetical protein
MHTTRLTLGALALSLGACATAPEPPPGKGSALGQELADAQGRVPAPLAPYIAADRALGESHAVLNAMLAGQHALDIGAKPQARALLDAAYRRIEVVYADNPAANAARSKFVPEARKEFKGEPYERAMVGWYLGLADLWLGDLDNARSALRWGEFQDTMSANETYQGDMAALQYLLAWSYHCQGRALAAREALALARSHRPDLPDLRPGDNLLVVVEAGPAPRKVRRGQHGEALGYEEREPLHPGTTAEVNVGSERLAAVLAEDLHWQATTLGGRQVDLILAGKASFKDSAEGVAQAASMTALIGSQVMHQSALQGNQRGAELGGALALGGLLTSLVSGAIAQATRPEADTRSWHSLPGAVFFASTRVAEADAATLSVRAQAPAVLGRGWASAVPRPVPGTGCHLARAATSARDRATWQADAAEAWMDLALAERQTPARMADARAGADLGTTPTPAADPPTPAAAPARVSPVRHTF